MSYADNIFIKMCQEIMEDGFSSEGSVVRPVWDDGAMAHTIKRFWCSQSLRLESGVSNYDASTNSV